MQEYIRSIFVPCVQSVCKKDKVDYAKQYSMLIIDSYFVHKLEAFRDWMRDNYPKINVLYVLQIAPVNSNLVMCLYSGHSR